MPTDVGYRCVNVHFSEHLVDVKSEIVFVVMFFEVFSALELDRIAAADEHCLGENVLLRSVPGVFRAATLEDFVQRTPDGVAGRHK